MGRIVEDMSDKKTARTSLGRIDLKYQWLTGGDACVEDGTNEVK